MLEAITVMSGGKTAGFGKGSRRIIDKGAHKYGGAKHVTRYQFASDKAALTAVLAMTGLLKRVPYTGCASIKLDGVKITGYFERGNHRSASGRYRRYIKRITVTSLK